MSTPLIVALILIALFTAWYWGRVPIIFRNVRPGGLLEHCDSLIRRGDGTKLFIRDERASYNVEVDKYFVSPEEIEITVLVQDYEDGASKILAAISEFDHFDRLVGDPSYAKFALIFRISRDEGTAITGTFKVLSNCLEGLNSAVGRTYELYYENKPIGAERHRSKHAKRLSNSDINDWQRRHAKAFLDKLDKQLMARVAKKNAELDERLRGD